MSGFKFNFSQFGKPKVKKTGNSPRREIVIKDIIGVINITIDGNYYVLCQDKTYNLTLESYDLKGKNVYYAKSLIENKTLAVISLHKQDRNNKQYLPFTVGSIVKGNVYKILNMERFNINKILDLSDIPSESYNYYKKLVHEAKDFYRKNYEEILKCIL